jgi:hypothetical protein
VLPSSLLLSYRYYLPVIIIMPPASPRSTKKTLSMAAAMKTEDA